MLATEIQKDAAIDVASRLAGGNVKIVEVDLSHGSSIRYIVRDVNYIGTRMGVNLRVFPCDVDVMFTPGTSAQRGPGFSMR